MKQIKRTTGAGDLACVFALGVALSPNSGTTLEKVVHFGSATLLFLVLPVFWLESLALWAFGISWFVKGETLWKDPPLGTPPP